MIFYGGEAPPEPPAKCPHCGRAIPADLPVVCIPDNGR
jgi:hypothetical protein